MSMLVHALSYQGREALVLACDDETLAWLGQNFAELGQSNAKTRAGFVLGNSKNVRAARDIEIRFEPARASTKNTIERKDERFTWYVSRDDAKRFQGLVRGLATAHAPAHQYLEGNDPFAPVLVLSKGEYEESALRSMSADNPAHHAA